MKVFPLLFFSCLSVAVTQAQNIRKGDFMLGGDISFSSTSLSGSGSGSQTDVKISPNFGYFFIDRFAGGLELSYQSQSVSGMGGSVNAFGLAPFLRYYFLPVDRKLNLFLQGNYGFGSASGNGTSISFNAFGFSFGTAIFVTPSTALEFAVRYSSAGGELYEQQFGPGIRQNTVGLAIGFQIHLPGRK